MAKSTRKSTAKKPPGGKPAGKSPGKPPARSSARPNGKPADWVDFNELKKNLAFAAVLDRYGVRLRGAGDQKHGFCPLPTHGGKGDGKKRSPSFSAHLGKKAFHCFGCGASGNPLDFACLMEGRNPDDPAELRRTALELQGDLLGGDGSPASGPRRAVAARKAPDPTSDAPDAENAPQDAPEGGGEETGGGEGADAKPRVVNAPLDFTLKLDPAHPYLPGRGYSAETIGHFGLGFCGKGLMQGRAVAPVHDAGGNLVAYAGRLVDDAAVDAEHPKWRFPGGREKDGVLHEFRKSLLLYNAHRIESPAAALVVVEGMPSVWWLWQRGIKDVVAVMGSSCSDAQADLIERLTGLNGRVILIPDGDDGGRRLAADLLPKVASRRWCRTLTLKAGTQPTDYTAGDLRACWR